MPFAGIMLLVSCLAEESEASSLQTRPVTPMFSIEPGKHDLGLWDNVLLIVQVPVVTVSYIFPR